ncbi:penicillin-insensitive murein endopeptidase [Nannocystis punicea]|uniref:Penicillin-insensitive murein endopeptidase n=1 Tax=Nannocystis punicea TaxID=2995304 RepID=A0ABY7H2H7_9BACT|nr:penicillin-insensitive murein endopeptidase [Nannocystis poenicansa]WAS93310.1 penicillin-insensitive murein endopeptidase [Nannocystis poenicansa]
MTQASSARPLRHAPVRRWWSFWALLLVVLCGGLATPLVSEAAAASSKSGKKSSSSSSSKKTSSSKKKPSKKPAAPKPIKPTQRDVVGPQAVPDGDYAEGETDTDGEGDLEDESGEAGDPESELEAIERELLSQPAGPEPEIVYAEGPPPPPPAPVKPRSLKHLLIPGETLDDVAKLYQVEVGDLAKWNGIRASEPIPKKKKDLRVITTHTPPPREKLEHVVKRGDTWEKIAGEFGIDLAELRQQNPRLGDKLAPKPKQKLKVVGWKDLDISPSAALGTKLAQIRVRAGGLSIGKPNRGKLVRGVELPDRPDLYVKRKPDEAYGSTHTIMQTLAAITRFRHESSFKGQVVIGGMSRARGGRFRPHKSHQSGRDVDIRLPLLRSAEGKKHTTSADVDWKATWQLMRAFLDTGEVEYIFLEYSLQKRIYKVARESGVSREQLDAWLEWPVKIKSRSNKRVLIRHVEGHRTHMHVRIRCGANEKHCYSSR